MAYEVVEKNARNVSEESMVSLGKGGVIYLNTITMKKFFTGVRDALLLYDKDKHSLAIKPLQSPQEASYKMNFSSQKSKSTGLITARSLLKALKLNDKTKKNIPATWNEKAGFLEVKLP